MSSSGMPVNGPLGPILQLLPANTLALFHTIAAYITPDGRCDHVGHAAMWALFGLLALITAVLAVNDRMNKKKATKKEYPPAEDLLYNVLRAALAVIAFGAGALLSAPATVCLFPGDTPGTSLVPGNANVIATTVILVVVSFLQLQIPGNPLFIPHICVIPGMTATAAADPDYAASLPSAAAADGRHGQDDVTEPLLDGGDKPSHAANGAPASGSRAAAGDKV